MVKVKFIGNVEPSESFEYAPLPKGAIKFNTEHWERKIFFSGAVSLIISLLILLYKRYFQNNGIFPFDRYYILIGCVIGILLLILHELLHIVVYPSKSKAVIGIEGVSLFAITDSAINSNRFVISARLPSVLLGIIPLVVSIFVPVSMIKINTLLWSIGSVGLITSCQDYIVVLYTLIHVPHNVMIQYSVDGLNYYKK